MFPVLNPKKNNISTHTSVLPVRRKLLASLLNGAIKQQHFKLYLTATGELLSDLFCAPSPSLKSGPVHAFTSREPLALVATLHWWPLLLLHLHSLSRDCTNLSVSHNFRTENGGTPNEMAVIPKWWMTLFVFVKPLKESWELTFPKTEPLFFITTCLCLNNSRPEQRWHWRTCILCVVDVSDVLMLWGLSLWASPLSLNVWRAPFKGGAVGGDQPVLSCAILPGAQVNARPAPPDRWHLSSLLSSLSAVSGLFGYPPLFFPLPLTAAVM